MDAGASVLAFISVCLESTVALYTLVQDYKRSRKDLESVLERLKLIESLLSELKVTFAANETSNESAKLKLAACAKDLQAWVKKLQKLSPRSDDKFKNAWIGAKRLAAVSSKQGPNDISATLNSHIIDLTLLLTSRNGTEIHNLRASIPQVIAQNRHREQMKQLSTSLGIDQSMNGDRIAEECERMYANAFAESRQASFHTSGKISLQQGSLKMLEAKDSYGDWESGTKSSLFLLSGENYKRYDPTQKFCWLSAIALEYFRAVRKNLDQQTVLVSTNLLPTQKPRSWRTVVRALDNVSLQLLDQNMEICDTLFHPLQKQIDAREQSDDRNEDALETLKTILKMLPGQLRVNLVIENAILSSDSEAYALIESIIEAICDPQVKATIKVLCTARSWYWQGQDEAKCIRSSNARMELRKLFRLTTRQSERLYWELGWEQKKLEGKG